MRELAAIRLLLATVGLAAADVQIFFTPDVNPWLSPGPASIWMPPAGNGTDWSTDGYKANFANFPSAYSALTTVASGETAYIWIKLNTDTQLGPIHGTRLLRLDAVLSATPADVAWYIEDDLNGQQGFRRFDGPYTPPNFPEFKNQHQILVAVNGTGIKNNAFSQEIGLYSGPARVGLLGAVKFDTAIPLDVTLSLGSLGLNFTSAPTAPPVTFGTLHVTPEPAAAVLLALAGLLIRRR